MGEQGEIDEIIAKVNPRYSSKDTGPAWENELLYESTIENLQPVYFWISDFANSNFKKVEKLKDNFVTSPGSGYFGELGARATKMQEETIKILGYVNTVIKSIVNLIYDLKEFDSVLKVYEQAKDLDYQTKEAGFLNLKQRWLDTVDMKRGRGSIHQMSYDLNFVTLRDAFMFAKSLDQINKMDLSERVKRILKPRLQEFREWVSLSERELTQRYNIEKSYLKNQISTLNLYTNWMKPYLSAAKQLSMKGAETNPNLVSVFSTMVLELELMAITPVNVDELIVAKDLPKPFRNLKLARNYNQVGIINFRFRTFPSQTSAHSGRVTINFKAYCLNDDELALLRFRKKEKDMEDLFGITSITQETLTQLRDDIEKYTKEEKKEEKKEEGAFSGIFKSFADSFGLTPKKKEEEKEKTLEEKEKEVIEKGEALSKTGIMPDSYEESIIRDLAEKDAAATCFRVFDIFKKSKGMASFVSPFDDPDVINRLREKRAEAEALRQAEAVKAAQKA
jgi:hypothetical protein